MPTVLNCTLSGVFTIWLKSRENGTLEEAFFYLKEWLQNKSNIPARVRSFVPEMVNRSHVLTQQTILHVALKNLLPCEEYCYALEEVCVISTASCLVENQEVMEVLGPSIDESVLVTLKSTITVVWTVIRAVTLMW